MGLMVVFGVYVDAAAAAAAACCLLLVFRVSSFICMIVAEGCVYSMRYVSVLCELIRARALCIVVRLAWFVWLLCCTSVSVELSSAFRWRECVMRAYLVHIWVGFYMHRHI